MREPALIAAGEGEVVGDSPERRVEILSDDETLHATWSRFGPRRAGADLHVHHHHVDLFYVLVGEFTLRLGPSGVPVAVPAGTLLRVPPLVVHGFRNGTDAELRYLNFHAPGQGFADFMRAVRDGRTLTYDQHDPPADGGRPPGEAVVGEAVVVGDGVTLLADVDEIAVAEVHGMAGGRSSARHLHRGHVESLYVLEGELAVTAGGGELRAPAGSWVQVPAGVAHTVWFPAPVRFLEVHTPGGGGFGAFLHAVADGEDSDRAAARTGFDVEPA